MSNIILEKLIATINKPNGFPCAENLLSSIEIIDYKPHYRKYYDIHYYGSVESYTINRPIGLPISDEYQCKPFECHHHEVAVYQPYYYFVDRAFVYPRSPLVVDKRGNILLEQLGGDVKSKEYFSSRPYISGYRKNYCEVIDDAILINSQYSSNYFHWHFDSLSKLEGLDCIEGGWSRFKFILNKEPSIWQKESLKLLGVDDDKIVYATNGPVMVNNLLVLSPRRVPFGFSKVNIEWLRKRLLSRVKISNKESGRKIFINRKDNERRCITNTDEVMNVLQDHGFEVVFMNELTMPERVGLFNNSKIIAGIHGAGLTNMMWAQKPRILEIFSDRSQGDLFSLSAALGFDYCSLRGKPERKGKSNRKNFHLDKDMLSDVLDHIS